MRRKGDDEGWWRRVVLKDGDWGKWWLREVVEWMCSVLTAKHIVSGWLREMVAMGLGLTKGSRLTYRKRWLKVVVSKWSSDFEEVMAKESVDLQKCWRREVRWLDTVCRTKRWSSCSMTCEKRWPNSHEPWAKSVTMKRHEMRWEELTMIWDEMKRGVRSAGVKYEVQGCEECSVMCEESVRLALHCTGVALRSCSWA